MGIWGVYTIASYGMAIGSKKKEKSVRSPERQPLLNAPEGSAGNNVQTLGEGNDGINVESPPGQR